LVRKLLLFVECQQRSEWFTSTAIAAGLRNIRQCLSRLSDAKTGGGLEKGMQQITNEKEDIAAKRMRKTNMANE
jgi:hypothetical protein